jgi:hypothetical protein
LGCVFGFLVVFTLSSCGDDSAEPADDGGGGPTTVQSENVLPYAQTDLIFALTTDPNYVYYGTEFGVHRYDKQTGQHEALAGNFEATEFSFGIIENPTYLTVDGDYLYFANSFGWDVKRVFLGNDGKTAVELIVPRADRDGFGLLAGNDTHVLWTSIVLPANDVYIKDYEQDSQENILATLPGTVKQMEASSTALWTISQGAPGFDLRRYEISNGAMRPIQNSLSANIYGEIATALSDTKFYWVNDDTLYSISLTPGFTDTPDAVAGDLLQTRRLTADESLAYALKADGIYKIDLATGDNTPFVPSTEIRDLIVYQGQLYWVTPLDLYTADALGTPQPLYHGTDGFGGAGGTKMVGVAGTIAVATGLGSHWMFSHDIASGVSTPITTLGNSFRIFANSSAIYCSDVNLGIARIPPDLNIREPELLHPSTGQLDGFIISDGWVYWSAWEIPNIARMQTDGSNVQILSDQETRGLVLYQDRLYFMCADACVPEAWTLASIPKEGGAVENELPLQFFPQKLVEDNGIFYIADLADTLSLSFDLRSFNLATGQSKVLFPSLPYGDVEIVLTPEWFFFDDYTTLHRYRNVAWDQLGPEQIIGDATFMAHDGSYLYHGWRGLWRAPD